MHVFLSYSHKDASVVDNLSTVLRAHGIPVWIDNAGLTPGTPKWDKIIRSALSECCWVVAACSEHSRDSNYVAIELAIAESLKKRIFPVWLKGTSWPQCAPMSLILSQHSDIRSDNLPLGLRKFLDVQLTEAASLTTPASKWPLISVVHENRYLQVNPFSFPSRAELLTKIFVELLQDKFPPFSYGEQWAIDLGGVDYPGHGGGLESIRLLWLPAKWAQCSFEQVSSVDPHWMSRQPDIWSSRFLANARDHSMDTFRIVDLVKLRSAIVSSAAKGASGDIEIEEYSHQPVGIISSPAVFGEIVYGQHPKSVTFSVGDAVRAATASKHCHAMKLDPIELEGVLIGSGIYFRILTDHERRYGANSNCELRFITAEK